MIYKSYLIIMHSLHISLKFRCSPIVKVVLHTLLDPTKLDKPQETPDPNSPKSLDPGSTGKRDAGRLQRSVLHYIILVCNGKIYDISDVSWFLVLLIAVVMSWNGCHRISCACCDMA